MHKSIVSTIAFALVVIGGLNWGLVGLFNYDLVDSLFGTGSVIANVIYVLIGVSALWLVITKLMKK